MALGAYLKAMSSEIQIRSTHLYSLLVSSYFLFLSCTVILGAPLHHHQATNLALGVKILNPSAPKTLRSSTTSTARGPSQ